MILRVAWLTVALILGGCFSGQQESERRTAETTTHGAVSTPPASEADTCPVTPPNGALPPGEIATSGSRYLGNGALWTELYPNPLRPRPEDVHADGSIEIKVPWWRGVVGRLTIAGRRLDAHAPRASAWIPTGYGRTGFQSTAVTFPTPGCWEVTGRTGRARLTFVSLILEPA
jgi:hypothetical protein